MAGDRRRVLIIDDEADARAFVETVIEEIGGFEILQATDGDMGVLRAKAEIPDLIVLDVNMPVKDGFTVFYELHQDPTTADIPVIMLTGVAKVAGMKFSGQDLKNMVGAEPAAFLDKPVDPAQLEATIRKVLGLES